MISDESVELYDLSLELHTSPLEKKKKAIAVSLVHQKVVKKQMKTQAEFVSKYHPNF